ncbi:MAG TPA: SO2930 family diheme c-type cytochrome [Pseudoxanthomonas sp.]|nr:SO2930 family diheme c-type cytochrome [Pseudoxanthomonas sp.]
MQLRGFALLVLALLLSACKREDAGVHFFAEGQPKALSEWRVLKIEDGRLSLNAGVVPYDLNTPLFSDYAHKLRTIWMPKGAPARYDAQHSFDFPVGTIISKTFYYPLPAGGKWDGKSVARTNTSNELQGESLDLSKVRLIETRLLVRREAGWDAMPYVWNEAQTEAVLKRAGDLLSLELVADDGSREAVDYQVPDQNQCASCHATDNKTRALHPIGPKARNLNRDFAYAGGSENQLAHLARVGYLQGAPDPVQAPRNADWQDAAHAKLEDRARAYLDVNCGHCHSPTGPAITSGMWLDTSITDRLKLGFCKQPVAAGKGTGNRLYDIAPGHADDSVLMFRMDSDDPSVMMPELGRSVVHREGVRLIGEWIDAQQGTCDI